MRRLLMIGYLVYRWMFMCRLCWLDLCHLLQVGKGKGQNAAGTLRALGSSRKRQQRQSKFLSHRFHNTWVSPKFDSLLGMHININPRNWMRILERVPEGSVKTGGDHSRVLHQSGGTQPHHHRHHQLEDSHLSSKSWNRYPNSMAATHCQPLIK